MRAFDLFLVIGLVFLASIGARGQETSSNRKAQAAYERAADLLRRQASGDAIRALQTAIELDPAFASPHQQLGDLYRRQRAYGKAIPHYRQVVELAPTLTPLAYF